MSYTNGLDKPSDYFNTKLYTGNGSTLNVTGLDFQPDFTWLKCRGIAYNHRLYDVIRTPLDSLQSNSSNAESADGDGLSAFNSDGFTVTQGANTEYNNSGVNYVGWNWLASNTTASNTDGSITSTVSANTTSGFSIVSYTGTGSNATVGHGLGSTPKFVTIKNRTTTGWSWKTHHVAITPSQRVHLNTTDPATTDTAAFNSTAPTSSVFSVGTSVGTNGSSNNYIAYCFSDVKGYSKFGSYTGNGSTDGAFVYTGFKPAWVMVKRVDSGSSAGWLMFDNKRLGYNGGNSFLEAHVTAAESSAERIDILSSGFKNRSTTQVNNASGGSYIYMAFASNPFVTSTGVPTTAR
jgi:hypothetical protein